MRDDSAEILFQSFLQEALVNRSGTGRHVHSLMLSIQYFPCPPSLHVYHYFSDMVGMVARITPSLKEEIFDSVGFSVDWTLFLHPLDLTAGCNTSNNMYFAVV